MIVTNCNIRFVQLVADNICLLQIYSLFQLIHAQSWETIEIGVNDRRLVSIISLDQSQESHHFVLQTPNTYTNKYKLT